MNTDLEKKINRTVEALADTFKELSNNIVQKALRQINEEERRSIQKRNLSYCEIFKMYLT